MSMDTSINPPDYSESANDLTGHQDDAVIAVMGLSGAGKSSFIKLLTGDTNIKIGNDLDSETRDIQILHFRDPDSGRKVTFVDTPGFDDSRGSDDKFSDTDILKKIADFLSQKYGDRKLNGLIYVQRISDPRFTGLSSRNLRMFRELCGSTMYKNVVVLTTFWELVPTPKVGDQREEQLKSKYFAEIVEGGAQFMRHDCTVESTRKVLRHFLPMPQKKVAGLEVEIKMSSEEMKGELREEQAKLQQELARWDHERSEMKKFLGEAKISHERLEAKVSELQAQLVEVKARQETSRMDYQEPKINVMNSPPPYEVGRFGANVTRLVRVPRLTSQSTVQTTVLGSKREKFQFARSPKYPPYLKSIPSEHQTRSVFDFSALLETKTILAFKPGAVPSRIRKMAPNSVKTRSMKDLEDHNHGLHKKSMKHSHVRDMFLAENIGHRDDYWYTDAAFGQQQFTGTNPTTITLAPPIWITAFKTASGAQKRVDVTRLLTDYPRSLFVQDYSDFRTSMAPARRGLSPSAEFMSEGRYGCSSVALFHLEPCGKLHPLAIVIDYKGGMENSVTIFNRRITSSSPGDEKSDWPWRYAKMCVQASDWLRHEVTVHLVNTHFVEEVIIVAANRTLEPHHIVFQLLEPHWTTTLSLNKEAREVLVPKIITKMTGFTATETYAFIKDAYGKFEWADSYVPNDLRRRGFPIEDLDKFKYHNYGYARNIARMWEILRSFVSMVLTKEYASSDYQVQNDKSISAFCFEVRSQGELDSFPEIKTLDELIDVVTMCIHIASPQHTSVNYLQQYYQTFVPNKPSALYTPLPQSLPVLLDFDEIDLLEALPVQDQLERDWLLMAQVPYLLSFEAPNDGNILHYAATISESSSTPEIIRVAALVLREDLKKFVGTVAMHSQELDDQHPPYFVLDPSKTAISILTGI